MITIYDATPPVIICPADVEHECDVDVDYGEATATDNCNSVTISSSDVVTSDECETIIERIWVAIDECGNASRCMQTITIVDTTNPVITCPADVEHECDVDVDYGEATATDNCNSVTISSSDVVTSDECETIIERIWVAIDDCGNASRCMQTITIVDTTPPVITCPEDVEHECDVDVDYGEATATDNCNSVTISSSDVVTSDECETIIERIWVAIDECGNASRCMQTITIVDTTAPVITCPDDVEHECDVDVDYGEATATDNCNSVTISSSDVVTSDECETIIERIWVATDDCGNASRCMQTITIVDTTAPVITCPDDIEHECDVDVDYGEATATDNCNSVTISSSDVVTSDECETIIERIWVAIDECGNASRCMQTITIVDTTPPVITCPEDVEYECHLQVLLAPATATDNCNEVTITSEDVTTGDDCETVITRTWTATDACGNSSRCVQTITILDTTAPVITCPADVDASCDNLSAGFGEATATDNCNEVTITFEDATTGNGCENGIERTWTATDACGNISSCIQTIIVSDTTPPVITCPDDVEHECDQQVDYGEATATDNCNDVTITSEDVETSDDCETIIERTWTATDVCGNSSSCIQMITIYDATPPVIICPADVEHECDVDVDYGEATATDNCNSVTISSSDVVTSDECETIIERIWVAIDECGNASRCMQTITIVDTTNPVITCPADVEHECDVDVDYGEATATDNCNSVTISSSDVVTSDECETIIERIWVAIDDCGNASRCMQTITIVDTTPPVITCPEDVEYECHLQVLLAPATATDNCNDVTITSEDVTTGDDCETVITRTWTATDACNNSSSCVQTITIVDTTAPVITYPANVEHECDEQVDYEEATATDNCNDVTITSNDVITGDECETVIERTWTATDACGNSSNCVQTITIVDTTDPVITCPEDVEHECDLLDVNYGEATALDNCNSTTISSTDDITTEDCKTTIERTWTATDACGNSSSCVQVITIVDTTAPVLSGTPSSELTINCQDEHPEVPEVTVTDNCDDEVTVSFEEIYNGFQPDPQAYENCEGIQPLNAEVDWSMTLFDLPGHEDGIAFYNTVFAQVSFYEDSGNGLEALLTGTVYDQSNPSGGWHINIPLTAGKGWEAWSVIEGNDYKDDFNLVGDAYLDWIYYLINSDGAYLEGWGDLEGSFLTISHTPIDHSIGWQHGVGANNVGPHLGLGGWMHFEGLYINSALDIDEEVSGAGDVAVDLNCCPTYIFTRVWSSTDCAGNETTFSQEITVLGEEAQAAQECIADFNYDGGRTTTDLVIFLGDYGCFTGDCDCDLDEDGFTTSTDLTIFLMYYGVDCENHNSNPE